MPYSLFLAKLLAPHEMYRGYRGVLPQHLDGGPRGPIRPPASNRDEEDFVIRANYPGEEVRRRV